MQSEESRWESFLEHPHAEKQVPEPWKQNGLEISPESELLMKMTIIRALRPDRLLPASK